MRILHLLSQRPDSTGSGVTLQAMLRGAAAAGDRSFLVAGLDESGWPPELPLEADQRLAVTFPAAGREHALPGMSDAMPYPSTRFRDLEEAQLDAYEAAFGAALQEAVRRFRPDVIHGHHLWIAASRARELFPGIPLVVSCHGSDLRQWRSVARLRSRALASARAERVLALSEAQRRDIGTLRAVPEDRMAVVGAGYRDELFIPREKPDPRPVVLVYAGKLSRAKGVPWLLRALAGVEAPAWRLELVGGGEGPEAAECLALAAALGDRVRVHGPLSQERLAGLLGHAHLFVLPSLFEGLPLVLIEALACGCRLVCTGLPGALELLSGIGGVRRPSPGCRGCAASTSRWPMTSRPLSRTSPPRCACSCAPPLPASPLPRRNWPRALPPAPGPRCMAACVTTSWKPFGITGPTGIQPDERHGTEARPGLRTRGRNPVIVADKLPKDGG
jgi:glycosyltransferase involved in cell wall biosynthesis